MSDDAALDSVLGYGALLVLGLFGAGANVVHAVQEETFLRVVIGYVPAVLLSLVLIGGAGWLFLTDVRPREVRRIGTWCSLGFVVSAGISGLNVTYQTTEGATITEPFFLLLQAGMAGAFGGLLVGAYDVRSRRRERELQVERDRIDAYNRRLSVLNRVLRHDIRSATTVIDGYTSLVRNAVGPSAEVDEYLDAIEREATRMHELGEKARHLGRFVESDSTDRIEVDLADAVAKTATSIRAADTTADLTVDVPSIRVQASPQLELAIEEVVRNAIEHHDEGRPEIAIDADRAKDDGVGVLRIEDDGPGIPSEELAVLERDDETQLEHLSGIGLWLVRGIVRDSGGSVRFERRSSGGTVVELSLPLAEDVGDPGSTSVTVDGRQPARAD